MAYAPLNFSIFPYQQLYHSQYKYTFAGAWPCMVHPEVALHKLQLTPNFLIHHECWFETQPRNVPLLLPLPEIQALTTAKL